MTQDDNAKGTNMEVKKMYKHHQKPDEKDGLMCCWFDVAKTSLVVVVWLIFLLPSMMSIVIHLCLRAQMPSGTPEAQLYS